MFDFSKFADKRVLVAPLNWGLGHATRSAAVVDQLLSAGAEVALAGDGMSGEWLQHRFPSLRYFPLPGLSLHYSKKGSQVSALLLQMDVCLRWASRDKKALVKILQKEHFDFVISDNRPAFRNDNAYCIYITHQLNLQLGKKWRSMEKMCSKIHERFWTCFHEVWIPDYEDYEHNLSGVLSHSIPEVGTRWSAYHQSPISYVGPISRFAQMTDVPANSEYNTVIVLSGLEPLRSVWESELISTIASQNKILLVEGRTNEPLSERIENNITIVPWMEDRLLVSYMKGAKKIIARSGYSTIMDLDCLGLLHKAEFVPTPGQPEQEYLSMHLATYRQHNINRT